MNAQKKEENGEDLRLQLVLPLDGGGRREMTATVIMTALNDAQQARFEAEVEDLLAQLAQRQVHQES